MYPQMKNYIRKNNFIRYSGFSFSEVADSKTSNLDGTRWWSREFWGFPLPMDISHNYNYI